MTIVALHYTNDNFFAMSDGLISRGAARVVEKTKKLVPFKPEYKIPRISLGRLNGFTKYIGGDFYVGFAGNYTLISTVITEFSNIVSRQLVLQRDEKSGSPLVYNRSDEGEGLRNRQYWDDYNFSDNELPSITVNFLSNILHKVIESASSDFAKNSMMAPDTELIIFGTEKVDHRQNNRAQVLKCNKFIDSKPIVERHSVLPWSIACIGDSTVIPAVVADIESDPIYQLYPSDLTKTSKGSYNWLSQSSTLHKLEQKRVNVMMRKILPIILMNTGSIGGDCMIARSSWATKLHTSNIRNEDIDALIDTLDNQTQQQETKA